MGKHVRAWYRVSRLAFLKVTSLLTAGSYRSSHRQTLIETWKEMNVCTGYCTSPLPPTPCLWLGRLSYLKHCICSSIQAHTGCHANPYYVKGQRRWIFYEQNLSIIVAQYQRVIPYWKPAHYNYVMPLLLYISYALVGQSSKVIY